MPQAASYQELARRYGLEPIPESVQRLTQLVSKQDADLDEVARLISKDAALTKRLLRSANPNAESEADYCIETVDEALMRNGVGCVLLLAMSTPLVQALVKTFNTMLSLKLESIDVNSVELPKDEHILGTIGFAGRAAGQVYLRLTNDSARMIAGKILGLEPDAAMEATEVKDTVGELLNIMTGNFKSNLCDAGLDCRLEPPKVIHTSDLCHSGLPGGSLERLAFRAQKNVLFVDVRVNPWNED